MTIQSKSAAILMISLIAALAGCASQDDTHLPAGVAQTSQARCATSDVELTFDFPGASPARCVIEGERSFSLVIAPEHAPPINPSPWYAFRYSAQPGGDVTVRLSYLEAKHRYAPKLTRNGVVSELPVSIANDERSALVTLPEGSGTVSAQPMLSSADYAAFAGDLARDYGGERLDLGRSLDGRPIEAIRFGDASADATIVILGRQHPPEVTGFYALEPFVRALARSMQQDKLLGTRYQILAVPLLNPDGVDRGHWRANRGGVDLNRDWGPFTQPETRAVRDWLVSHANLTTPIAMIDFHSTGRNLFYVQGDEAGAANERFLAAWLTGQESRLAEYPFTIEKRNANPGSGTAKNWFFECYAIPAYTYEVGDDANPATTAKAASLFAARFVLALPELARSDGSDTGGQCRPDAFP